jgi:ribulose-bisphosphate carboxylase large chain
LAPQDERPRDEIIVRYLVDVPGSDIDAVAAALAVEQSVEMPLAAIRHPHVLQDIVGRVRSVSPAGGGGFEVELGLASATVDEDPAQLLNMVFGNCSLLPHVELVDLELPPSVVSALGGPRWGIEGLRRLVGAQSRPLTCTALKPLGLGPADLAELASTFASAGIDLIKDDHGFAGQHSAPFAARLASCQEAVERANQRTGGSSRYVPSLVGSPASLHRQAALACDAGVRVVLVAPMLVGMATFAELVAAHPDLAFLGHPAFAGAQRIGPPLLLGSLFRLYGADAVIFPNYGGRFTYGVETCAAIAERSRRPWSGVRPTLPVPAGGMTVERVEEMVDFYGADVVLLIGGALLSAGDQLAARSRQFVAAVGDSHRERVA